MAEQAGRTLARLHEWALTIAYGLVWYGLRALCLVSLVFVVIQMAIARRLAGAR